MFRHIPALSLAGLMLVSGIVWSADPPASKDGAAPTVTVSGPYTHANLTIFLLQGKDTVASNRTLLTLQEAMAQKKLVVHETSEVNELSIENVSADIDVFVQSGDIVRGGKQDRLLAVDMIVPPKSGKIAIQSFCCESGRWRQRGGESVAAFAESSKQAGNKEVKLALNAARDQGLVWEKVKEAQRKLAMNVGKPVAAKESPTSYQLTLEDKELLTKLETYEKDLTKAIDGKNDAIGFVMVINGKIEGAEMYGSAALFRKLWPKLISAAAVDALSEFKKDKTFSGPCAKDVQTFLHDAEQGKRSEVAVNTGRSPDGQQAANANPRGGRQQRADSSPPASQPPARVRIVQRDSDKILMLESQDKQNANVILHRSYIAK